MIDMGGLGWRVLIPRVGEAGKIPRRIDESVHRVSFAPRGSVAGGTGDILPCRVTIERVAGLVKSDIIRQFDGEIRDRNRHSAAFFTMNDRNRATPIALPGDAPIAELEIDFSFSDGAAIELCGFETF